MLRDVGDQVIVSDLLRLDCRVGPLKRGAMALLTRYDGFFALDSVRVVGFTAAVCDRAASIRAEMGSALPTQSISPPLAKRDAARS